MLNFAMDPDKATFGKSLAAYVLPFALFIGGLSLVSWIKNPASGSLFFQKPELWIYPLQTLICGAVLIFFWREYDWGKRPGWLTGIAAGGLVLGLWIAPQVLLGAAPRLEGFDPTVFEGQSFLYWLTILSRFARLVIVVPLMEEIFWRGFLMRYLIDEDFQKIRIGIFRWKAFVIVSLAFMLVHSMADWPAALACGIIYNLVAIRTGSLGACILAHSLTNLGLGIYIMATRQWGFW